MPLFHFVIAQRSFKMFSQCIEALPVSRRPAVLGVFLNMLQLGHPASIKVLQQACDELPREWLFDTAIPRSTAFLDASGLKGVRIGVQARTGNNPIVDKVLEQAISVLKAQGAEVVDPAPIETAGQLGMNERDVLQYEFKADLNAYLATMPAAVKPRTLADIIAFNAANETQEMPYFGQETFIASQARGPLTDQAYLDARAKCIELTRTKGIDATMDKNKLDAMLGPSGGIASLVDLAGGGGGGGGPGSSQFPAVSGYPHITVPAGFHFDLPLGVSFYGRAWSEPVLLRLAYAFEQATKARRAPGFTPTLALS